MGDQPGSSDPKKEAPQGGATESHDGTHPWKVALDSLVLGILGFVAFLCVQRVMFHSLGQAAAFAKIAFLGISGPVSMAMQLLSGWVGLAAIVGIIRMFSETKRAPFRKPYSWLVGYSFLLAYGLTCLVLVAVGPVLAKPLLTLFTISALGPVAPYMAILIISALAAMVIGVVVCAAYKRWVAPRFAVAGYGMVQDEGPERAMKVNGQDNGSAALVVSVLPEAPTQTPQAQLYEAITSLKPGQQAFEETIKVVGRLEKDDLCKACIPMQGILDCERPNHFHDPDTSGIDQAIQRGDDIDEADQQTWMQACDVKENQIKAFMKRTGCSFGGAARVAAKGVVTPIEMALYRGLDVGLVEAILCRINYLSSSGSDQTWGFMQSVVPEDQETRLIFNPWALILKRDQIGSNMVDHFKRLFSVLLGSRLFDPNQKTELGETPLLLALEQLRVGQYNPSQNELAQFALGYLLDDQRVDVNQLSDAGTLPLAKAVRVGYYNRHYGEQGQPAYDPLPELLCHPQIDVNLRQDVKGKNQDQSTALMVAIARKEIEAIKMFVDGQLDGKLDKDDAIVQVTWKIDMELFNQDGHTTWDVLQNTLKKFNTSQNDWQDSDLTNPNSALTQFGQFCVGLMDCRAFRIFPQWAAFQPSEPGGQLTDDDRDLAVLKAACGGEEDRLYQHYTQYTAFLDAQRRLAENEENVDDGLGMM